MKKHSHQRASVLILVLWTALGLVVIALLFGHSMRLTFRAAENRVAGWQAEQAIEAGLRYAIYLIQNLETFGAMPDLREFEAGAIAVGEAHFWFIGRADTNLNGASPVFGIQDESSKLNLNTATLEMLQSLPFMSSSLAASIVDWRDEDEELTEGGAESPSYLLRNPSFESKNAPFDSIDELHLLHGAEPQFLYGEDINQNGILDPNENDGEISYPSDNQDGRLDFGILEFVSVHNPIRENENQNQQNQQNQNSQIMDLQNGSDDLEEFLKETFGEEKAEEWFDRILELNPNESESIWDFWKICEAAGMSRDEFAQIEGFVIASQENSLININTASEAVLSCVPGIGMKAASIVAHRQSISPNASITWLGDILDEDSIAQSSPFLTGTTLHYLIDIAAVGRGGKGYRRTQFVIRMDGQEPKIVSRKDLLRAGWALGEPARRFLDNQKQNPSRL